MISNKNDLRLIVEMQKDGIASYSDLAARLGITPKTVAKRVEGLITSKLITIRAQPNPYKLGLSAGAVIAIKADPSKIEHICDLLCEHFCVNLVQTVFGRFDIMAIVYFRTWELLHKFMNEELYSIDGVTQTEFYFIKEVFKRFERFFDKEPYNDNHLKLDETDWALIEELARDGRVSQTMLAEKLGVHVTTVYRRIAVLVKEKIIKISGVPNPSMLKHSANAYITVDVEPKEVQNLCNAINSYDEVHFTFTLSNRSGMIICVHTKNTETLFEFLKKRIAPQKGLLNIETHIRAVIQKTYYGWLKEPGECRQYGTQVDPIGHCRTSPNTHGKGSQKKLIDTQ